MYQALYRKYRPKTFDEVVGQDIVIKTLKNSILNNKISHAYLLSGPKGCGKTSIAKLFAKLVNCQNPNGSNPCNKCVCCTQQNDQNLDIIEMDAASNNGVDEIREINNKVNLVPSIGKYKVYIIDEVHMLTIGAFNALLKTLEEPPAHVIFILATTDPHKVPITILSRCQRFDLKKISEDNMFSKVKYICETENIQIEEDAIKTIAHLGDGSLRDALSLLDQVLAYSQDKITIKDIHDVNGTISQNDICKLFANVIDKNLANIINLINEYNNSGKSIVKMTEEIILYLRNAILAKTAPSYIGDVSTYKIVVDSFDINEIMEYIQIFNKTLLDMKKFTNSKILLELSFINIIYSNFEKNNEKIDLLKNENFPGNEIKQQCEILPKDCNVIKGKEKNVKEEKPQNVDKKNVNETNENLMSKINKFIDTRVSNTLSKFSKKNTVDTKQELKQLEDYIMDEKNGIYVSMILDGELKAVGDNYLIFTYGTQHLANAFNEKINELEKTIKTILNKSYKIIAVDLEHWNDLKEKFNSKKQQFEFKDEELNIDDILKELNGEQMDNIQSLFGELVEYK